MASFGYDGDIGAGEWVTAQRILGCRYAVLEPSHFQLGATVTGVTLSAGAAGGGGVYDSWETTQSINLTKPGSGWAWWMIVIRRNWTTLGSSLVAIPAGTSGTTPALPSRYTVMGDIDDQPLWLVAWPSSSSTPVLASAVDLRLIGRGPSNYVATSDRVREYFVEAGALLRVADVDWICAIGVGGVLGWQRLGGDTDTGKVSLSLSGWTAWYRVRGKLVEFWASYNGSTANGVTRSVATGIPSQYRPASHMPLAAYGMPFSASVAGRMTTAGTVEIINQTGYSKSPLVVHGCWMAA